MRLQRNEQVEDIWYIILLSKLKISNQGATQASLQLLFLLDCGKLDNFITFIKVNDSTSRLMIGREKSEKKSQ